MSPPPLEQTDGSSHACCYLWTAVSVPLQVAEGRCAQVIVTPGSLTLTAIFSNSLAPLLSTPGLHHILAKALNVSKPTG